MTNREYVNSLSDKEFAEWVRTDLGVYDDAYCEKCPKKATCTQCDQLDIDSLTWWLGQEFAPKTN